jgi:glycosyltransferase involved in cell wall biosynthesis
MKVLHLPYNIASQISFAVKALHRAGIQARGFVMSDSVIQSREYVGIQRIDLRNRFTKFVSYILYIPKVARHIIWAEIIHWYFGETALPFYLDLYWARLLRKPCIVEFWGSDIRVSDIEANDNPYYAEVYNKGEYGKKDKFENSRNRQYHFAKAGCECLISCHSLKPYIFTDLFPKTYFVRQRLNVEDIEPSYPDPGNSRPLVVHSPSNPLVKGTKAILSVIDELGEKYDFDFKMITGIDHNQALLAVREADIYIDQLILGGHGLAALEAMALGKPVICYIKPSMMKKYPLDLPIVNANKDNFSGILSGLLQDSQRRHDLGVLGRKYVEKYHNAHLLVNDLVAIYTGLLKNN